MQQVDFLVLGQGLAGSILAFELISRGKRVLVIDNNHQGSASVVAAGVINPITGHRLNLTHDFVAHYARAKEFYAQLEIELGIKVIKSLEQVRLLKNPGQADYCDKRLQQQEYQEFLAIDSNHHLFRKPNHGTVRVKQTSVVSTKRLLKSLKEWLIKTGAYRQHSFNYAQLQFNSCDIQYDDLSASGIIFCEGYQAINNPWLQDLPFKLSKGEVLTVEQRLDQNTMLNWGNWLIPDSNNLARLGSSYAWQDTLLKPSSEVSKKLLASLEEHTGLSPKIMAHEVGVRPTTLHRQPFVGSISNRPRAYCFNGFGSKGCLTIPSHADLLCNHLLNHASLPKEICQWL